MLLSCYFYPRSPCGERPGAVILILYPATISIHALLAESDCMTHMQKFCALIFLSTLSLRRATQSASYNAALADISIHALLAESDSRARCSPQTRRHFYPRSPCGERPARRRGRWRDPAISIHALLAESDLFLRSDPMMHPYFYPRSPCGERLVCGCPRLDFGHFYPRSPCGERPGTKSHDPGKVLFLSTLSLRRATTHP